MKLFGSDRNSGIIRKKSDCFKMNFNLKIWQKLVEPCAIWIHKWWETTTALFFKVDVIFSQNKSSLVSPSFWPQFLIFQKNSCARTSMFLTFRSMHKNFVEKLKIVVKNLEKLNCSYMVKYYVTLKKYEHMIFSRIQELTPSCNFKTCDRRTSPRQ